MPGYEDSRTVYESKFFVCSSHDRTKENRKFLFITRCTKMPIDGRGLFMTALRGIEKGRVITIVEGRRRRKRMWSPYAYGLNAKVYIKPDGWAKFVNQCNQPNSRIQKWNYG